MTMPMVAFHLPKNDLVSGSIETIFAAAHRKVTVIDNVAHAGAPLSSDQIADIENLGFERADTHWYAIEPLPAFAARGAFLKALGQNPSTTVHTNKPGQFLMSFVEPLSDAAIAQVAKLGSTMFAVETPDTRGLRLFKKPVLPQLAA